MPATTPLNATVPAAAARTTVPAAVPYVTPRLPAHHWQPGSRNGSTTGAATGGNRHDPGTCSAPPSDPASHDTTTSTTDHGTTIVDHLFLDLLVDPDAASARLASGPRRQATPAAVIRARRWSTDLVWICGTRLSLTPSTRLIWARVRPSS